MVLRSYVFIPTLTAGSNHQLAHHAAHMGYDCYDPTHLCSKNDHMMNTVYQ